MNMKKKIVTFFSLALMGSFLAACSTDDQAKRDTTQGSEPIEQITDQSNAEPQSIIGGLKIIIDKQEINQKKTEDGEQVLHTFTITAENMGSVATGLGSIDFLLETEDGELLELDHTMAMFGNEIAVGETITGQVSFALEEGQVAKKLIYKPGEEQLAEWDVKSE